MFHSGEAGNECRSMRQDAVMDETNWGDDQGACDTIDNNVEGEHSSCSNRREEHVCSSLKVVNAGVATWKKGTSGMTTVTQHQRQRQDVGGGNGGTGGERKWAWSVAKHEGSVLLLLSSSPLSKKTGVFLAPRSFFAFILATTLFLGVICGIVLPYLGMGQARPMFLSHPGSSRTSSISTSSRVYTYFSIKSNRPEREEATRALQEEAGFASGSENGAKTCNPYTMYGRLVGGSWKPFCNDCPASEVLPLLQNQSWGKSSIEGGRGEGGSVTLLSGTGPNLAPPPLGWLNGRTIILVGDSQDRNAIHDFCELVGAKESMHHWNGLAGSCVAPLGCPRVCQMSAYNLTLMSFFVYGLTENESIPWTETHRENWEPVLVENRLRHLLAPFLCAMHLWPDLIVLNSGLWDLANWGRQAAFSGVRLAGTGNLLDPVLPSDVHDLVVPDSQLLWWLSAAKHRFVGTIRDIFSGVPLAWRTIPFVDVRLETVGWPGAMGIDHVSLPGLSADVAHGPYQVVYVDALNQAALQLTKDSAIAADDMSDAHFDVSKIAMPGKDLAPSQMAASTADTSSWQQVKDIKPHSPLLLLDWNTLIRGRWDLVKEGLHYHSLGYTLYLEMVLHHVRQLYDHSPIQHSPKEPPKDFCQLYPPLGESQLSHDSSGTSE